MDNAQKQVEQFHRTFRHPVGESGPQLLTLERAKVRAKWMREEVDEFIEAVEEGDLAKAADAMADLRYFAIGTDVEMGVDGQRVFNLVHEANMGKQHLIDGELQPVFNDDGKVVKPEGWEAPDEAIAAEILEQQYGAFVDQLAHDLSLRGADEPLSHSTAADFAKLRIEQVCYVVQKADRLRETRLLAEADSLRKEQEQEQEPHAAEQERISRAISTGRLG